MAIDMEPLGWLTLLPPLVAIFFAIVTRQVILSLFLGVWMGWTILSGFDPLAGLAGALAQLVSVFADGYNTKVILFSALVGSLITLTQRSGGVEGFVRWMQSRNLGATHRGAGLVAFFTGVFVFVESSITCLVVGSVARPLTDRVKMSREKLAYICDSTSAPVCILIPLNAWGAYIMSLLAIQRQQLPEMATPLKILLRSIPLNFYAWIALGVTVFIILSGRDFGPMAKAEKRARETGKLLSENAVPMIADEVVGLRPKEDIPLRSRNMLIPLLVMILMMPVGLYITGRDAITGAKAAAETSLPVLTQERAQLSAYLAENKVEGEELSAEATRALAAVEADLNAINAKISTAEAQTKWEVDFFTIMGEGSGSTAVFWAVFAAICVAGIMYMVQRIFGLHEVMNLVLKGAGGLVPMAVIMMLAFAINSTCNEMGTGAYVASLAKDHLRDHVSFVPLILFAVSCFIAFSTGTSWGTFGIMMPIGVPVIMELEPTMLMFSVSAILGGGVFGDHCSPISDTTVVSSMASACDHIDHVRTQLPYALTAAAGAAVIYLVIGIVG